LELYAEITVSEAWAKMQKCSDGLAASHNELTRAQLQKDSAESMYLPSLSLNTSYTHLNKPINVDTSGVSDFLGSLPQPIPFPSEIDFSKQDIFLADLQLLWPLYTGGKIDAAQEIYDAKVSEAQALHEMKKDKAFLNLVKTYYGVMVSQSLYETRREVQKALQLHFNDAKKLKEQGQIATVELLNAEVKLEAAVIETTKAKHQLDIVTLALAKMIKSDKKPSSNLFVYDEVLSQEYYKSKTVSNYSGLKILDAKASQSASMISIKEAAWHPKVLAYGSYNLYKDDSPLMEMAPEWLAGVALKINLLERKDRSQEIQAAKLLNSKVNHLRKQAQEDLELLLEKTYNEMLLYRDEFNSLSASIKLAKENYRLRSIAFSEGLITSVEVVDAQMFLAASQTKRLNAAYNFIQKISQLAVLSGERTLFFESLRASKEIE
jgi:outer membrane protein TolC